MNKIIFYKDKKGNEAVYDFIQSLSKKKSKDSRIKLNKIGDYIEILSAYSTTAGESIYEVFRGRYMGIKTAERSHFISRLCGWQLCFIAYVYEETTKTPRREIEKAKQELQDFRERGEQDE